MSLSFRTKPKLQTLFHVKSCLSLKPNIIFSTHRKLTLNTKKRLKRAAGQTYLQVAAQTVALQVSLFVLVQFDLVLFGHRVPHHNATLGHQLDKLFSANVRRQTWGEATRRSTQGGEIRRRKTQWRDTKVRSDLATPTWHIDVCVFIVINVEPSCRKRKMTNFVKLTKQMFFWREWGWKPNLLQVSSSPLSAWAPSLRIPAGWGPLPGRHLLVSPFPKASCQLQRLQHLCCSLKQNCSQLGHLPLWNHNWPDRLQGSPPLSGEIEETRFIIMPKMFWIHRPICNVFRQSLDTKVYWWRLKKMKAGK